MVQLVSGFYTTLQTLVLFSLKSLLIVKKKTELNLQAQRDLLPLLFVFNH